MRGCLFPIGDNHEACGAPATLLCTFDAAGKANQPRCPKHMPKAWDFYEVRELGAVGPRVTAPAAPFLVMVTTAERGLEMLLQSAARPAVHP